MEIIIYQGPTLKKSALTGLARRAVQPFQDVDLEVRVCQTEEQLSQCLGEVASGEADRKERYFPFKTAADGYRLLKLSQVLCFKGHGHRITAVLTDGREWEGKTLRISITQLLSPLLETGQFLRSYRSVYVNTAHITAFSPHWVHMDNGETMQISQSYYGSFLDRGFLKKED